MENPVTQPGRNGGTLKRGNNPGKAGSAGRKPDELRAAMRENFAIGCKRVKEILDGSVTGDVLKATDIAGKYGMGALEVTLNDERILVELASLLPAYLPQDQAETLLSDLKKRLQA